MIKPILDNVIVRPFEVSEQTKSGVILAPTVKEQPEMGEVLAVGPGKYLKDGQFWVPEIHTGETIIFVRGAGTTYEDENEGKYLVLRETDIFAVVR